MSIRVTDALICDLHIFFADTNHTKFNSNEPHSTSLSEIILQTNTKKVFTPVQTKANGQWSKKQGARKYSYSSL